MQQEPSEKAGFLENDILLEHHAGLETTFLSGHVSRSGSETNYSASLVLLVEIKGLQELIEIEKEILNQNPLYTNKPDFSVSNFFGRNHVSVRDANYLENAGEFSYTVNRLWIGQRFLVLQYHDVLNNSPVVGADPKYFEIRQSIVTDSPAQAGDFESLKGALFNYGYLPLHLGIQLKAPGLPTKLYTNAGNQLVSTPFGDLPSRLQYLDLRSLRLDWDGTRREFTEADLKYTS